MFVSMYIYTGGTYSGEMKKDDCTHLLVDAPKGQKYEFARKWQLATVHSRVSFSVACPFIAIINLLGLCVSYTSCFLEVVL